MFVANFIFELLQILNITIDFTILTNCTCTNHSLSLKVKYIKFVKTCSYIQISKSWPEY